MYLDGIRDTAQYNRETFNLEQIDVLRRCSGDAVCRGQAGGDQPGEQDPVSTMNKVTASFGTDNFMEQTGDFNKVLGEKHGVARQRDEP